MEAVIFVRFLFGERELRDFFERMKERQTGYFIEIKGEKQRREGEAGTVKF